LCGRCFLVHFLQNNIVFQGKIFLKRSSFSYRKKIIFKETLQNSTPKKFSSSFLREKEKKTSSVTHEGAKKICSSFKKNEQYISDCDNLARNRETPPVIVIRTEEGAIISQRREKKSPKKNHSLFIKTASSVFLRKNSPHKDGR